MGFRTVVVLNNDLSTHWMNDPELGRKISVSSMAGDRIPLDYGQVLECTHADTQTLAVLDGYNGKAVSHTFWYSNQTKEARDLELLKQMADKMGYRLVCKSQKTKV